MDRNRGCFSDTRKTETDRAALHRKIFCGRYFQQNVTAHLPEIYDCIAGDPYPHVWL